MARRTAARFGLTLIELLVVLGVMLAMAAIALPVAHEAVQRRQFESAVDDVVGTLRLARAHARLEASTVEVLLVQGESGGHWLVARQVDFTELAAPEGDDGDAIEPIAESWAERRVGAELSVADRSPPADATLTEQQSSNEQPSDEIASALADEAFTETRADDADSRPRRVALFAADGSAPVAAKVTLRSDDGRVATVRVNPWTGLAAMEGSIGKESQAP